MLLTVTVILTILTLLFSRPLRRGWKPCDTSVTNDVLE